MDISQAGGGFKVVEPAAFPEKPYKPNRIALIVVGFIVAFGTGLGMAAMQEMLDKSIKSVDEIKRITGIAVFSAVSMVETSEDKKVRKQKRLKRTIAVVLIILLMLIVTNWFIMPLDMLIQEVMQQGTH